MALDTKFADMTDTGRTVWHRWANSHDWGANRAARFVDHNGRLALKVFGSEHNGTEFVTVEFIANTPRELRDWAGY